MTREKVAKMLASRISEDYFCATPVRKQNKISSWSKSILTDKGKELEALVDIFRLDRDTVLEKYFAEAISGDGDESSKILTLHSSSLLAFLCFSNIRITPISIQGTEYVEVMFEVKNDVIHPSLGKPSNMDVLLLNKDRSEILFLESKFTEYLSGGRARISSERYRPFYEALFKFNNGRFDFSASNVEVKHRPDKEHPQGYVSEEYSLHKGKRSSDYLNGIKQAFSHLLGIATGPLDNQTYYTRNILDNAKKITFASIVFNCNQKKFQAYSKLYNSVFSNEAIIKNAIRAVIPQSKILDKLKIHPALLTYQDVFKEYNLPEKIQQFYSL